MSDVRDDDGRWTGYRRLESHEGDGCREVEGLTPPPPRRKLIDSDSVRVWNRLNHPPNLNRLIVVHLAEGLDFSSSLKPGGFWTVCRQVRTKETRKRGNLSAGHKEVDFEYLLRRPREWCSSN